MQSIHPHVQPQAPQVPFVDLPDELQAKIIAKLSVLDAKRLGLTCRDLFVATQDIWLDTAARRVADALEMVGNRKARLKHALKRKPTWRSEVLGKKSLLQFPLRDIFDLKREDPDKALYYAFIPFLGVMTGLTAPILIAAGTYTHYRCPSSEMHEARLVIAEEKNYLQRNQDYLARCQRHQAMTRRIVDRRRIGSNIAQP